MHISYVLERIDIENRLQELEDINEKLNNFIREIKILKDIYIHRHVYLFIDIDF